MPNRRKGKSHQKKIEKFKKLHPEGRKGWARFKREQKRLRKEEKLRRLGFLASSISLIG